MTPLQWAGLPKAKGRRESYNAEQVQIRFRLGRHSARLPEERLALPGISWECLERMAAQNNRKEGHLRSRRGNLPQFFGGLMASYSMAKSLGN